MKRTTALFVLLLVCFLTCKKEDNNPVSTTPPTNIGGTPEPTPIGTPVEPPTTATIGAAGGTLTSSDGTVSVTIPAGALAADTTISVQTITNNAPGGLGTAYRLGPSGMHFSSPVTLRFTYSTDSVQVPELLGVAYQDTDNIWYSMPDYTIDSIAHTLSVSISHFSDWTDFERVIITPTTATLGVNQYLTLELVEIPDNGGNQQQPIYTVTDNQVTWSASAGTISRIADDPLCNCVQAKYRAPASVPSGNPVRVGASVSRRFTYHGTAIPTNRTVFFSYITIRDSTNSFHLDIYFDDPQYMVATLPFDLADTCGMDVLVNRTVVSVSNITNHDSRVTPPSAQLGQCTITWIPTGPGPMNITGYYASIDTEGYVNLVFIHHAIQEEFQGQCPGEPPQTQGGGIGEGEPPDLHFPSNFPGNSYYNTGGLHAPHVTFRVRRQ